jgi:hypothetical protein
MVYRGKKHKSYQQNEGDFSLGPREKCMNGLKALCRMPRPTHNRQSTGAIPFVSSSSFVLEK